MPSTPSRNEMSGRPTLESLGSEAHIWLTGPAEPEASPDYLRLLAPEELEQYERFKVEKARRLYLAARALARSTLSLYYPAVEPADWRFKFNRHGRPEIDGPDAWPPLRFNLSHTDGLVACLVTLELDAGVDVEFIERRINLVGVAKHSFSKIEAREVRARAGRARRTRFFSYWTLKEAYIKARGMGLALPLRRFSYGFEERGEPSPFNPSTGGRRPGFAGRGESSSSNPSAGSRRHGLAVGSISIHFDPEIEDRESEWQLALYQARALPGRRHSPRRGRRPANRRPPLDAASRPGAHHRADAVGALRRGTHTLRLTR